LFALIKACPDFSGEKGEKSTKFGITRYLAKVLINKNTALVKSIAKQLGFDFCGISKAEFLEEEAPLRRKPSTPTS
jgi:hypothetical protein